MLRRLRPARAAWFAWPLATLAGCAAQADSPVALEQQPVASEPVALRVDTWRDRRSLLSAGQLYSAFDGVHEYQMALSVVDDAADAEAIDASTLRWRFDSEFLSLEPDLAQHVGVLLTTRRAGATRLSVSATATSGRRLHDSAIVTISAATPEQWEVGDAAFDGDRLDWSPLPPSPECSEPAPARDAAATRCAACHTPSSAIADSSVSAQTSTYSDEALVRLFSEGVLPEGHVHTSPFLQNLPPASAHCVFQSFHSWDMPDAVKLGLLFKLRSLVPDRN